MRIHYMLVHDVRRPDLLAEIQVHSHEAIFSGLSVNGIRIVRNKAGKTAVRLPRNILRKSPDAESKNPLLSLKKYLLSEYEKIAAMKTA